MLVDARQLNHALPQPHQQTDGQVQQNNLQPVRQTFSNATHSPTLNRNKFKCFRPLALINKG
jgi:hypothetical protein